MIKIIYIDQSIVVCIKPAGVLSTDEPGGLPEMLRDALNEPHSKIRTVHRLDRVVSGLMVLARTSSAASRLSEQVRDGRFKKHYLAVVHGTPPKKGTMNDLLTRDSRERKTYVTDTPGKDARQASLEYKNLCIAEQRDDTLSLVDIILHTGRTHQIRCQFSSREYPLVGDKKYSVLDDGCDIALWSAELEFEHPQTRERVLFKARPQMDYPWSLFSKELLTKQDNSIIDITPVLE